jgi:zinc and cadmium transporter
MDTLIQIIIATFLVSLISFVGIIALANKNILNKFLVTIIAFASGALIGSAFLHLIPEASEKLSYFSVSSLVLSGFVLFFLIEKGLHWRHCHEGKCKIHPFSYLILAGDTVHNFLDGLIIAASFIISPAIGLTSTIAIALHEIPQEIGDFGVVIYGGMKKRKALFLNFLVALTAVLGGVLGFFLKSVNSISTFILPVAAGGFIYIASSDLLPELKKEIRFRKSLLDVIIFLIGIALMLIL